jgi:hypothetical protein
MAAPCAGTGARIDGDMASLPPDFWDALRLLAKASDHYREATGYRVVIVGGAAVSFYTQGQVLSGDFDMVADVRFEASLLAEGFQRETEQGRLLGGFFHPDVPRLGFELVSRALFDGLSDRDMLLRVRVIGETEGQGEVVFPAVEDLIADRLGQYAASNEKDREMLDQAKLLKMLALEYDHDYLKRRIVEESGDPAAIGLE